jgi:hypothetical protein
MDVLTLDLSKSGTGWARYCEGDAAPKFGTWVLGNAYTDRAGAMVALYLKLQEACVFGDPDLVCYESPLRGDQQSSEDNNRLLNALAALVEFFCRCKRITCREVNNRTWKAEQLTNKRLKTGEIKQLSIAMAKRFGLKPQNDNEADALHILDFTLKFEKITPPWRELELMRDFGGGE